MGRFATSVRRTVVAACTILLAGCAAGPRNADYVLTGGVVWTGTPGAERVSAIAIGDGRVLQTGTDDEVRRLVGSGTREIDLQGRMVMPGFIDNHAHFIRGGFQLASVDLRDAASPAEFTRRIRDFAATLDEGRWIMGGIWDHELWGGELPRREWVDSVTTENPVFVGRLDGHMALANSATLELAGITAATPDPDGGTIVRDPATGEPTGILKDNAMDLVSAQIPEPSDVEYREAFERAQEHALASGVTLVNDMGSWPNLETYRRAHESGDLKVRMYSFVPISTWERLRDYVAREGRGDAQLKWGGLKGYVDGSLGSTTAWFYEPYSDDPSTSGLLTSDTTALREWILDADAAELHVAVHAIGDRANDWLLAVFADAEAQNGVRDRRFRIEHAQHLTPEAIDRMAAQGVIPSMQPYHAIDDGRWAEKRIGADRIQTTYAFRSLLDAGAHLTLGSDWTVAPLEPLLGVYAAVTRRTIDDANPEGWVPEQKITLEEALHAYTVANAYASRMDSDVGRLESGHRADLVILSEDLFAIDPNDIPDAKVDLTMVGGEIVFQRAE